MWTLIAAHCQASRARAGIIGLVLTAALPVAPAIAKLCGDDVEGRDVPCACGDVVVSSVALGDDPVVQGAPCPHEGLVIRAPDTRRALVIDLRGQRLRGQGGGTGIRIVDGGPGGARVISSGGPATIAGFEDGVVARGTDTVALVEDVVVTNSHRDGVRVSGPEFEIRRVEVHGAGRDGFALGGRGFQIGATRVSDCGRFGYFVMGAAGQIGHPGAGNLAERSGQDGFNVMGAGHILADCTAVAGRKSGLNLHAAQLDVRGCRATDNGGDGIKGLGNDWQVAGNEALRNAGDGITMRGVGLIDEGGNHGADNRGLERDRGAVQCVIGGTPCAP